MQASTLEVLQCGPSRCAPKFSDLGLLPSSAGCEESIKSRLLQPYEDSYQKTPTKKLYNLFRNNIQTCSHPDNANV